VLIPFLKAKRLSARIELDSSHQSRRDLSMHSKILQRDEEKAMGRKEVLELGLGIEITRYEDQEERVFCVYKILLKILRESKVFIGRFGNIKGEILSIPEAGERREEIALLSLDNVKGLVRIW